jgi:predicted signal transduction protein with EAL and GGDEF domain
MKNDLFEVTQGGTLAVEDAAPARSPLLDAKIMMVDDEPLMTELIQTHLEDAGYSNFVVTNDPRDALPLLRTERPGLLLLDLMMPQLSGFDVLAAIRADPDLQHLPVIVLTAATGSDAKLRALRLGASDFLAKPVDESELALRVRNTLAFRQYHERLLNVDAVTGLPNHMPFDRALNTAVERQPASEGLVALLVITVPELRALRESFDDAMSDQLAVDFARRLEDFIITRSRAGTAGARPVQIARLGHDQFGCILEAMPDIETIEQRVKEGLAAVMQSVVLGGHEVVPAPWVGVAVAPTDGNDAAALRKSADLAWARAKELGTLQYAFASPELNARSHERLSLGLQLRGAVSRDQLRLHFQPKVDLVSGRIVGAEALVRWQHPERGLVPPGQFIPLAEELGLISPIGNWVLEHACREAAGWRARGLGDVRIAVNVAKPQFAAGDLPQRVRQALFDSGLPARLLVIELTESMLVTDVGAGVAVMRELKELGVTLSIDDFGTGYSSLSYLKTFPVDELKIDRSFVCDLPGERADKAIVGAVVALGHSLGMSVTAEGVETQEQLDSLRGLRCDTFQGFLYSRPVPADAFEALLVAGNAAASSRSHENVAASSFAADARAAAPTASIGACPRSIA